MGQSWLRLQQAPSAHAYADGTVAKGASSPHALRLASQPAVHLARQPVVQLQKPPDNLKLTSANITSTQSTRHTLPSSKSLQQLHATPKPKSLGSCSPASMMARPTGIDSLSDDELRLLAEEVLQNFVAHSLLRKLRREELDSLLKAHLGDQHAARLIAQRAQFQASTERIISSSASLGAQRCSEARLEDAQHKLALAKAEALAAMESALGRMREREEAIPPSPGEDLKDLRLPAEEPGLHLLSQMSLTPEVKPVTSLEGVSLEEHTVVSHERSKPRVVAADPEDLSYIFGEKDGPSILPAAQPEVRFPSPPRPLRVQSAPLVCRGSRMCEVSNIVGLFVRCLLYLLISWGIG